MHTLTRLIADTAPPTSPPDPAFVQAVKPWLSIAEMAVGIAAIVIGGFWVWWKFFKGRTFRPRLEVAVTGTWQVVDGAQYLGTAMTVKNIGGSRVTFQPDNTLLRVSRVQPPAPDDEDAVVGWKPGLAIPAFAHHRWIEPGESISDEAYFDLHVATPQLAKIESRITVKQKVRGDIITDTTRIVAPMLTPAPNTEVEKRKIVPRQPEDSDDKDAIPQRPEHVIDQESFDSEKFDADPDSDDNVGWIDKDDAAVWPTKGNTEN